MAVYRVKLVLTAESHRHDGKQLKQLIDYKLNEMFSALEEVDIIPYIVECKIKEDV